MPLTKCIQNYIQEERGLLLLKVITNSGHHMQNLIEDALDMSRIENGKFEINSGIFDIREAVQETISIMQFQTDQKGISLDLQFDSNVSQYVKADKKRYN